MQNIDLLIIIGLPGSGKSRLAKNFEKDFLIFDDFIGTYQIDYLVNMLLNGNKICITDPRLCLPDIFDRYVNKFLQYIKKSRIYLILYKNDPEQCIKNIKLNKFKKTGIRKTIIQYSEYYDLNNYLDFKHYTIDVYHSRKN